MFDTTTTTTDRPGSKAAMKVAVLSAAVPGTSILSYSARPAATGTAPSAGTTISASGWPELVQGEALDQFLKAVCFRFERGNR
jgi:hypothetical protein